jgi:DNA-binding NtrC family response regulator
MTVSPIRVLVVEDDVAHSALVRRGFDDHAQRFLLSISASLTEARLTLENTHPDVVITDVKLPDGSGTEFLAGGEGRGYPVIVMTGHGHEELAVAAMKSGASDYLIKSPDAFRALPDLAISISQGWKAEKARVEGERNAKDVMRRELDARFGFDTLVGRSDSMRAVTRRIRQVAQTTSTVLITGESGVGKEVVARSIHRTGARSEAVFLPVNCAAIPQELLESQLFGHVRGSFSGAVADYPGLFLKAAGGTIFLDEIGELPVGLQAKLLRAIEAKEFLPVGASEPVTVDLRIIAATNSDLETSVQAGSFREDLFWRLNVFAIEIPPLRERLEDVPALAEFFMKRHNRDMKRSFVGIDEDALAALLAWAWRGNVRELNNVIEHAMIVGSGTEISVSDLPERMGSLGVDASLCPHTALKPAVRFFERAHIASIVRLTTGDKRRAADLLGIGVSTLYRRMEELGVDSEGNLFETGAPLA